MKLIYLQLLVGPAELRRTRGAIKDDKSSLEGDVADNGETDLLVGLNAAEADFAGLIGGRVVDVLSGNGDLRLANAEDEVGERGGAREDVAALGRVQLGARHGSVVRLDHGGWEHGEGGARIRDAREGG